MTSYEERIRDLAEGGLWGMSGLSTLIGKVDTQRAALEKVIANLPEYWKGESGSVLRQRLEQHKERLKAFAEFLHDGQQQVTGNGQFSCSANSDNTDRVDQANAALGRLPSTILPTHVLDQVQAGAKVVEVVGVGPVDVAAQGIGWVAGELKNNRERAAEKEYTALHQMILTRAEVLGAKAFTFDMTRPPYPPENGPDTWAPGHGTDGGFGPGIHQGPRTPFGNPNPPTPPTGPPTGPPVPPPVGPPVEPPVWPPVDPPVEPPVDPPVEPPVVPPPPGTDPPGTDGTGTDDPSTGGPHGDGPRGPSVDSGLDGGRTGLDVRSGLGAAGLGAVGLAAGAKLAGSGGSNAFGAFAGPNAAGGGIIGSATGGTAAGGGANSGANSAGGKGTGGGRPGMMMGGQGGGATEKKGGINRLGYVAPKFEDEYEENTAHPSARAGKRSE